MKLQAYLAYMATALGVPLTEFTEIVRSLKAQSSHFEEAQTDPVAAFRARSGPGGGVDVTEFHVAFLLISMLIGPARKDLATNAWQVFTLKGGPAAAVRTGDSFNAPVCPVTGERLFGEALMKCIEAPGVHPLRFLRISWRADQPARRNWAELAFEDGTVSRFGGRDRRPFERVAEVEGNVILLLPSIEKRDDLATEDAF